MASKEFKINKTTKKIINYDGKEISVDEFNQLYHEKGYPALARFEELFKEIFYEEKKYKEFKKLHSNLGADIEDR